MSFLYIVGGIPHKSDFAPSLIFAILYALLIPLVIWRRYPKERRTYLFIGTILFALERIDIFVIRCVQALAPKVRENKGILIYSQTTISLGYISMAQDMVMLLRILLVNTTKPRNSPDDDPVRRRRYRIFGDLFNWFFLAATVPGGVAGGKYSRGLTEENWAKYAKDLRDVSASITLFCLVVILARLIYALRLKRINKRACWYTIGLTCILLSIPIYRMTVLNSYVPAFTNAEGNPIYTSDNPANSTSHRVGFYLFHMLPEWITAACMLGLDVRNIWETGKWGDWKSRDNQKSLREAWHYAKWKRNGGEKNGPFVYPPKKNDVPALEDGSTPASS